MTTRLARHVGWTVLDHGAFTGAGFLFTLLLAVLLVRDDYGAFTVSYAALLLVTLLHSSAIAEPLLVVGPLHFESELTEYLRTTFAGNALISIAAAIALGLVAIALWLAGHAELATAFAGAALAFPGQATFVFVRRAAYAVHRARAAAICSAAYFVSSVAGLLVIAKLTTMTSIVAYLVSGGTALACALVLAVTVGIPLAPRGGYPRARAILDRHWSYSKWGLGSGIALWLRMNLAFGLSLAVPGLGLSGTASLRAAMNLIMPPLQVNAAIGLAVLPTIARNRAAGQRDRTWYLAAVLLGVAALYWLALVLFGRSLLGLVYRDKYADALAVLPWLGAIPMVAALELPLRLRALAAEHPGQVFAASAACAVAALGLSIALAGPYGLVGLAGAILGSGIVLVVMLVALGRGTMAPT